MKLNKLIIKHIMVEQVMPKCTEINKNKCIEIDKSKNKEVILLTALISGSFGLGPIIETFWSNKLEEFQQSLAN